MSYYGARYYMAWFARWTSCDPVETEQTHHAARLLMGQEVSSATWTRRGTEDSHAHGKKHRGGHKKEAPKQKPKHKTPAHKPAPKPSSAAPAAVLHNPTTSSTACSMSESACPTADRA